MRNLFSLVVALFVCLSARADFQSLRASEVAIRAYSDLALEAQNAADLAYPHGHFHHHGSAAIENVTKLDAVSDLANFISRELHQNVYRLLRANTPEFKVDKQLDRLKQYQVSLNQSLAQLGQASTVQIQRLAAEANRAWIELDRSLDQDFGHHHHVITANCVGKTTGRNHLKSHVECTVFGQGVKGYEVNFSNNGATARAQGQLDPRIGSQAFISDKVSVGFGARYTVLALTFNGQLVQVAQGVCQH